MRPTTVGTVPLDCPVCRRRLDIPIHVTPAAAAGCALRLVVDLAYLRAHCLTHGPHHDGEPLLAAA